MRAAALTIALAACERPADTDTDTDDTEAAFPPCPAGTTFLSWTRDGGATLAPVANGPSVNTYTWGIAVLPDRPDSLYAEHGGTLWRSDDGGCTLAAVGALSDTWWPLFPLPGGRVWGYAENGTRVVHIDDDGFTELPGPGDTLLGMGTDPADPDTVWVGTTSGGAYARDGEGWTRRGAPGSTAYGWAFDPSDPRRMVAGLVGDGVAWSHDGGATFTPAAGFDPPTNVFTVAWSPVDSDVVWALGLDLDESDAGAPHDGRHVWRSPDGGRSFVRVVDQDAGAQITLTNGMPFAADARDPDVAWFVFGSSFMNEGTWLYRYDAGEDELTFHHTRAWDDYRAIAFGVRDPALMYVALVDEVVD